MGQTNRRAWTFALDAPLSGAFALGPEWWKSKLSETHWPQPADSRGASEADVRRLRRRRERLLSVARDSWERGGLPEPVAFYLLTHIAESLKMGRRDREALDAVERAQEELALAHGYDLDEDAWGWEELLNSELPEALALNEAWNKANLALTAGTLRVYDLEEIAVLFETDLERYDALAQIGRPAIFGPDPDISRFAERLVPEDD